MLWKINNYKKIRKIKEIIYCHIKIKWKLEKLKKKEIKCGGDVKLEK